MIGPAIAWSEAMLLKIALPREHPDADPAGPPAAPRPLRGHPGGFLDDLARRTVGAP